MDLPPWEQITRSDVEYLLKQKADHSHTHNGMEAILSIVRELRQMQETNQQELTQLRTAPSTSIRL